VQEFFISVNKCCRRSPPHFGLASKPTGPACKQTCLQLAMSCVHPDGGTLAAVECRQVSSLTMQQTQLSNKTSCSSSSMSCTGSSSSCTKTTRHYGSNSRLRLFNTGGYWITCQLLGSCLNCCHHLPHQSGAAVRAGP